MVVPHEVRKVEPAPSREGEKRERPIPLFHGVLVTPESLGILPNGFMPTATFNAAVVPVVSPSTKEVELMAVYRVQNAAHEVGHADKTAYFGMQRFSVNSQGKLEISNPFFQDATTVMHPENRDNNPEDMRLGYRLNPQSGQMEVYGGLTQAAEISRQELFNHEGVPIWDGRKDEKVTIPLVATITGVPLFDSDGHIAAVQFHQAEIVYEYINGIKQPIVGKNAWQEDTSDGNMLLRYRPEFIDGEVNTNVVRTLVQKEYGVWEKSQQYPDKIYPLHVAADILPEGYQLLKYGLNGKGITTPHGEDFRIDHFASVKIQPNGKELVEYGFITVDGKIKPLLSYTQAIELLKKSGFSVEGVEDLSGNKNVIYCNGYAVVGDRLVMAVTFFDRMIGVISYDLKELAEYAIDSHDVPIRRSPAA